MSLVRRTNKSVLYMIWDTENQCFDSLVPYYNIEEAITACEDRNHSVQGLEYVDDGNFEYTDELPDIFEVRKVTVEKIAGL